MANPIFNLISGGNQNTLMMLVNAIRSGGNPQALLNTMARNNPKIAEAMQLLQGKTPDQLERICRNVCAQKGVDFNSVVAQVQQMMR